MPSRIDNFMKRYRGWCVVLFLLTGCSTNPGADFCDWIRPGRLGPTEVTPYGGVLAQQHAITPISPVLPAIGPGFPPPPGGGFVPPAAPLPGPQPAGGFQLQPPLAPGDVPPPPPAPPSTFGR
jgi:hypothetical protein